MGRIARKYSNPSVDFHDDSFFSNSSSGTGVVNEAVEDGTMTIKVRLDPVLDPSKRVSPRDGG